jgi:NAD(P)-dependent dehydrogenase (short-subunit alcohol dehydrogenase family)
MNKTAIVLGVTANIGGGLCERLLVDGWRVAGIGRDLERLRMLQGIPGLSLHRCDIESADSVRTLQEEMSEAGLKWDFFLSCVGTMEPIGKFFELDFEIWAHSIAVNFTAQLRVLHGLWPLRQAEKNVDIMLLAGGGTSVNRSGERSIIHGRRRTGLRRKTVAIRVYHEDRLSKLHRRDHLHRSRASGGSQSLECHSTYRG